MSVVQKTLLQFFMKSWRTKVWIFTILAFSTNFCPLKGALSGNTFWQQEEASGFQTLAKNPILVNFCLLNLHMPHDGVFYFNHFLKQVYEQNIYWTLHKKSK